MGYFPAVLRGRLSFYSFAMTSCSCKYRYISLSYMYDEKNPLPLAKRDCSPDCRYGQQVCSLWYAARSIAVVDRTSAQYWYILLSRSALYGGHPVDATCSHRICLAVCQELHLWHGLRLVYGRDDRQWDRSSGLWWGEGLSGRTAALRLQYRWYLSESSSRLVALEWV